MGCAQAKDKSSPGEKVVEGLKNKVTLLQGEINELMCIREGENKVYERELMVFAFKQGEWIKERKRLKREVKKLRKMLEEKEETWKCMQIGGYFENEWDFLGSSCIMEHFKDEKLRRDETVEKWKKLYFAIKVELDDLIERTHQEEIICWKTGEEESLTELKKEMGAKEEIIEVLQSKLASMEQRELKRVREMDILRQSLRIVSHGKKATSLTRGYSNN